MAREIKEGVEMKLKKRWKTRQDKWRESLRQNLRVSVTEGWENKYALKELV